LPLPNVAFEAMRLDSAVLALTHRYIQEFCSPNGKPTCACQSVMINSTRKWQFSICQNSEPTTVVLDATTSTYPVSNNLPRGCALQRWQACPHEHRQDVHKRNCDPMSNDASQLASMVIAQTQVLLGYAVIFLKFPARLVHSCHFGPCQLGSPVMRYFNGYGLLFGNLKVHSSTVKMCIG
jgi:hypothetical protein